MKKIILALFVLVSTFSLWSQSLINSKSAIAFRNAQTAYDDRDYGKALNYAEDAVLYRKQQVTNEIKVLNNSLIARDVKAAGDSINAILLVLKERGETDCINIINSYVKKMGNFYFNDSMTKLLEYIEIQKNFPEAQKLLGDIYKIEGEYYFAEQYYLKALECADTLDIPDEKYAILYTMAELSRLSGDFQQMEIRLLNITTSANGERNKVLINSVKGQIKKNKGDSVEKLFTMYRSSDYYNLDAYCQLAEYYVDNNQYDKALGYCSLAVITGFTKMYNLISKRDMAFEYTGLEDFLLSIQNYDDILKWGIDNKVWESFNQLAKISMKLNYNVFADKLLRILAKAAPEPYWQQEAVLLLDTVDGIK